MSSSATSDDYYAVLGVPDTASAAEIKRAYRRLALRNHPDVNKSPNAQAEFSKIAEAYAVLSDQKQRAKYDMLRRSAPRGYSTGAGGGASSGYSSGRSSASSSSYGYSRSARDEAEYSTDGDSFGALFGDLARAVLGGEEGWMRLLDDLAPSDEYELAEILTSRDPKLLAEELESARFVAQCLRERVDSINSELSRSEAEATRWSRRAAEARRAALDGGGGSGRDMSLAMEREIRREIRQKQTQIADAKRLLAKTQERERRIMARQEQLRRTSTGGTSSGTGSRQTSSRPRDPPPRSSRLPSVEEELQRLKREMGR